MAHRIRCPHCSRSFAPPALPPPPDLSPTDIRAIRHRHDDSTAAFGARLGVSGRTVEDWEQGRRRPSPAIRRLIAAL